ncbi:hypothetical protein OSTOST_21882, partial [Ostertagia ostertagi]
IPIDGQLREYGGGGYCMLLQGPTSDLIAKLKKASRTEQIGIRAKSLLIHTTLQTITSVIAYYLRQVYIDKALENFAATNGNVYINLELQRNVELLFTFCLAGVVFFVACKMIKIL